MPIVNPVKLTHWGRVTHICVSNLTIIGSDNGLSPDRRQAIIWTNAGILLIRTLGTNFSEILSEIHAFSFKKMHLKMSSAKWRLFRLGLNELRVVYFYTRRVGPSFLSPCVDWWKGTWHGELLYVVRYGLTLSCKYGYESVDYIGWCLHYWFYNTAVKLIHVLKDTWFAAVVRGQAEKYSKTLSKINDIWNIILLNRILSRRLERLLIMAFYKDDSNEFHHLFQTIYFLSQEKVNYMGGMGEHPDFKLVTANTLRPSDAYMRQWTGSSVVEAIKLSSMQRQAITRTSDFGVLVNCKWNMNVFFKLTEALGRFERIFLSSNFQANFSYLISVWIISCEIALKWMALDSADYNSTLIQVMACCREATSHYLDQCWPRSM